MKAKTLPSALQHLVLTFGAWIGLRLTYEAYLVRQSLAEPAQLAGKTESSTPPATKSPLSKSFTAAPPLRRAMRLSAIISRPFPDIFEVGGGQNGDIAGLAAQASGVERKTNFPDLNLASLPGAFGPAHKTHMAKPDNWSLAAWAIVRPDSGKTGLSPNGQLGGSQFGFRVQRRLAEPIGFLTVSGNVRVSAPLRQPDGKEAGVGLAIRRSGRVPVELIAERRIGLDHGGRGAFAGLVAMGVDDVPVPIGFRLSGYAQAGIVGLRQHDGFADGALRVEHDVASIRGISLRLGAGVWSAVQPGVSRIDLGPSVAAKFRLGKANLKLAGEWRGRVAGKARPGSGPAFTLGLDY